MGIFDISYLCLGIGVIHAKLVFLLASLTAPSST